ncbi:MAG: ABC transporter permease [Bryobacteraceae bacterium]
MRAIREIRFALRSLRKSPAMTATAIGVVALGIGANAALFTVFNAVLLRPLPYPHSERIVELMRRFPGFDIWAATPAKFDFWRRQSHSFEAVSAQNYTPIGLNLTSQGEPERLLGLAVTADYFKVLGMAPALGRTFTEAEDRPGAGHYAVLSHSLWKRLFEGKPEAIGATLRLGGTPYTVIGAMPAGFDSPQHADLWTPLALTIDPADHANDYTVLARLKPGATLESAQGDMRTTGERLRAVYADLMGARETVGVVDYHDYLVAGSRTALLVLMGAVALVLLMACANVANLLLARYTGRQHEIAVQRALGATGWTLLRQLLTESLLLSGAGAAAGLLLADSLVPLLMRLAPTALPQFATPTLDGRVILFAVLLAVATGVLFTLAPAFHGARAPVADALREAGTRTTEGSGAGRLRRVLVIAEVSISFVLLVGAGLLAETFQRLSRVEPGFDAQNAVTTQVSIGDQRFARTQVVAGMAERVASRLEALPGVVAAASTDFLPVSGLFDLPFEIVGRPVGKDDDMLDEKIRTISPHYFAALRIPVLAGRVFSARDTQASAAVMLVNQAFAKKYFPKRDPLGQEILIGRNMGARFADRPRQIVGVVGDTRDLGLGSPAPPEMFVPLAQVPDGIMDTTRTEIPLSWVIRSSGEPMALAGAIRREMTAASGLATGAVTPLEEIVADSLARERFSMVLLGIFGALALLLGTVGLYGVISYSVAQRTNEIGIRSALGAAPADLLGLVLRDGMRLVVVGLAVGLAGSLWLSRFLRAMLYGVTPGDPAILTGVAAVLVGAAALALLLPARRAARIDPAAALRAE